MGKFIPLIIVLLASLAAFAIFIINYEEGNDKGNSSTVQKDSGNLRTVQKDSGSTSPPIPVPVTQVPSVPATEKNKDDTAKQEHENTSSTPAPVPAHVTHVSGEPATKKNKDGTATKKRETSYTSATKKHKAHDNQVLAKKLDNDFQDCMRTDNVHLMEKDGRIRPDYFCSPPHSLVLVGPRCTSCCEIWLRATNSG
jgi:hypothetical protein